MDNSLTKYLIIGGAIGLGLVVWKTRKNDTTNPNVFGADFPTQVIDKGSLAFGQSYVDNYAKMYADKVMQDYFDTQARNGVVLGYSDSTGGMNNG